MEQLVHGGTLCKFRRQRHLHGGRDLRKEAQQLQSSSHIRMDCALNHSGDRDGDHSHAHRSMEHALPCHGIDDPLLHDGQIQRMGYVLEASGGNHRSCHEHLRKESRPFHSRA